MSASEGRTNAKSVAMRIADSMASGQAFDLEWSSDVRCYRTMPVEQLDANGNTVVVEDSGLVMPVSYKLKRELVSFDRGIGEVGTKPIIKARLTLSWTTKDFHAGTIPFGVIDAVARRYSAIKKSAHNAKGIPCWNFPQTRMLVRGLTVVMANQGRMVEVEDAVGLLTMFGIHAEHDWLVKEIKVGRMGHRCNRSVVRLHEVMLDVQAHPEIYFKDRRRTSIYNEKADMADMVATSANPFLMGRGICQNPECDRHGKVGHVIPFCVKCGMMLTPTGARVDATIADNAFDMLVDTLSATATATAIGNQRTTTVNQAEILAVQDRVLSVIDGFLAE